MKKLIKQYEGLGLVAAVAAIRAEGAAFKSSDARGKIIDSAVGNANDTLWEIRNEPLIKWFNDRYITLPEGISDTEMRDLAHAHITHSGICSNTCYPSDFGASSRDIRWFHVRGFIG